MDSNQVIKLEPSGIRVYVTDTGFKSLTLVPESGYSITKTEITDKGIKLYLD